MKFLRPKLPKFFKFGEVAFFDSMIADGFTRVFLASIFFFCLEGFIAKIILKFAVTDGRIFYGCTIAGVGVILCLMPLFGKSDLLFDLRELYTWDLIIQISGLILYMCKVQNELYIAGNDAVWLCKVARFCWFVKGKNGYVGWPPFGIWGWLRKWRNASDRRGVVGAGKQDSWVYAAIFMAFPFGFFITHIAGMQWWWQLAVVPIALVTIVGASVVKELGEFVQAHIELQAALERMKDDYAKMEKESIGMKEVADKVREGLSPDEVHFIAAYLKTPKDDRKMLERIAETLAADNIAKDQKAIKLVWRNDKMSHNDDMKNMQ